MSRPTNSHRRRLIGRRFEDPVVKKDIESWPFKVVDQGGNPVVQVEYLNETKTFSPQEISSMVLMKVKFVNVDSPCAQPLTSPDR
jgi:heat shock protein 1/8